MNLICQYCGADIPEGSEVCPSCGALVQEQVSPETAPETLPPGYLIINRYRIDNVLGIGGFGITYLGIDTKLERKVAIKEYFPEGTYRIQSGVVLSRDSIHKEAIDNFIQEGRSLAKFNNPGIVRVFDAFEANGTAYMVMEFVEGIPLSDLLGKIDESKALKYAKQVAIALKEVHENGMLHQDIKPQNLIMFHDGKDERIKIIDFGSAKIFKKDMTKTYEKVLTPGFAPPEQYGEHVKRGPYTDMYSLSATVYSMIKGAPPPSSIDISQGYEIDYTGIAPKTARIIGKGLSLKIEGRIKDAEEFLKLLEANGPADMEDTGVPEEKRKPEEGRKKMFMLRKFAPVLVVSVLAIAFGSVIYIKFLFPVVPPGNSAKPAVSKNANMKISKKPVTRHYSTKRHYYRHVYRRANLNVSYAYGFKLFKGAGCLYCHRIRNKGFGMGPDLTHEGSRRGFYWIKIQILNPDAHFPGGKPDTANGVSYPSVMPPYRGMPLRKVNIIARWLANLK